MLRRNQQRNAPDMKATADDDTSIKYEVVVDTTVDTHACTSTCMPQEMPHEGGYDR